MQIPEMIFEIDETPLLNVHVARTKRRINDLAIKR